MGKVQDATHVLFWQTWPPGQACPQAPQLATLLRSVSQPFEARPSQSWRFAGQDCTAHAPPPLQVTADAGLTAQGLQLAAPQP
jgi:hypothetical protein